MVSKTRWFVGLCIPWLMLFSMQVTAAEEKHGEHDHGAETVSAEADPGDGHEAGHGDAHGKTDEHGEAHGEHGGEHHNPFDDATHGNATPKTGFLDGQNNPAEWKSELAIWTVVVFGCLTALLWKYAWGPIASALDSRERTMQDNIDAAAAQNEKAAKLLAEHEAKLANTADEVRKILEDARRDAETAKAGILAEAEAAADAQKTRALQEIDAAKNGALQELAEKSVDTAVGLAGKIVRKQLSPDDHASLISDAIKAFPSKN